MILKRFQYIAFSLLGLLVFSCVKDKPELNVHVIQHPELTSRVFIINEGNFSSGNASISLYNTASHEVQEDVYKTSNNLSLGDVAQSMNLINDKYYLVVNNSGKIVVCDKTFKMIANITGLTSPRYILQVSAVKAYASDFKSGAVSVINLTNNTVSHTIAIPGWTEEMRLLQNKVYVCNVNREYLYLIDPNQDKVEDSIWVGKNTSGIQVDKNNKVWVLSSGDFSVSPARLSRINPNTKEVEKSFQFPAMHLPFKLAVNRGGDSLYFIKKDIFVMPIDAVSLPDAPIIAAGQSNFYGIGIFPHNNEIYMSDALDYVQRSHITVYSATGIKKTEFKAGINANGFYFE